jgi:twitching motility protein PilT
VARIDRFIAALIDRGADRLELTAGCKARLILDGRPRAITSAELHVKQLDTFVREIVPSELADEVLEPGDHRFMYSSPSGCVVARVERGGDHLRVEVECAAEEPSAPPPSDPEPATPAVPIACPSVSDMRPAEGASAVPDTDAVPQDSVQPGPETAAMDALFREMVEQGCSDLHLSSGSSPLFRKDGGMTPTGQDESIDASRAREMLYSITPPRHRAIFEEKRDADFSYEIPDVGRFRCNLFMDRKGPGGVFRVIPNDILTVEDLGLSPQILELCHLSKGLVVVTGPTGSGKSTTLAAMIDYVNRNLSSHIITIEDPIEFVHPNKQCLINQREIGNHTDGFKPALRAALREDPDIVLVGEMRDLETVEIAIETAETGHLVFGTLHTNTAASTVDRVIDQFPSDRQEQVRAMLSTSLKGVIAQTLCKKKGGGRVAALEVLIANAAVSNLIREGKTFQIGSIMQTGKKLGMVMLCDALAQLVEQDLVEADEALAKAANRAELAKLLAARGLRVEDDAEA